MGSVKILAAAVLFAVELGGVFGSASATVESIDESSMLIELSVEVQATANAVVAHLSFGDETPTPTSLLDRGGGVFGIRTELEPKNYVVVFEIIGPESSLSDPRTLTQLGAVLSTDAEDAVPDDESASPGGQLGWLALALAAASLSALAFWALGGRDDDAEAGSFDGEE